MASAPCITNSQGQFSYAAGDALTFSVAGVSLGTTSALQPSTDGSTTVTPVNLVSGATLPSDPGPTAIAQFLQTLSSLAAGTSGSGAPGILTMPTDAVTTGKLSTALSSAGITSASSISTVVTKMQSAMDTAFGANQFTVVPASTAQAALTQGVNSNGIIGTVWNGTCAQCGGGSGGGTATIYFQPGGTVTGFSDGNLLAGSWAGSTTSGAGVTVQISNGKDSYATGSIPANSSTGTATIFKGSPGVVQGSFTFTKITASGTTATNTQYMGGWYATFTPNAARLAAGDTGGTAYIIAAPDGTFYGITDGSNASFKGTWSTANGQGTATWTDTDSSGNPGHVISISMNLAAANGTVDIGGQPSGTLTFNRQGTLTRKTNQNNNGVSIPLQLGVAVSWANNSGANTVTSLALGLSVFDANGALVSSTVRSESTAPRFDGFRTTITDNIAVSYPTGSGATYSLSAGGANCTITGASGAINDANSGNPGAYPTVNVTCDPNSTVQLIPLLLKVITTWGNKFPSPGYGLSLHVNDPTGNQVGSGFVQQNIEVPLGTVTTTTSLCGIPFLTSFVCTSVTGSTSVTTTTNISASYPKGGAATYVLSAGTGGICTATAGASGPVVDTKSGNAAAYPTVFVACE